MTTVTGMDYDGIGWIVARSEKRSPADGESYFRE
jgi:hypothetical protein